MRRAFILLVVFLWSVENGFCATIFNRPIEQKNFSENQKYSAELSFGSDPGEIVVAVFEHSGEEKKLFWSREEQCKTYGSGSPPSFYFESLVSNDGASVVIRDLAFSHHQIQNGWLIMTKGGGAKRYATEVVEDLIGGPITRHEYSIVAYYFHGPVGMLDFISDETGEYAAWFPATTNWMVINLKTIEAKCLQENEPLQRQAKERALRKVRQQQSNMIKAILKPLQNRVADLLPGFQKPREANVMTDPELYASYLFLGLNRNSESDKYIRNLLESPFPRNVSHARLKSPPSFYINSPDRLLGDLLLSEWENLSVLSEAGLAGSEFPPFSSSRRKLNFLAELSGTVKLPMVVPDQDGGSIWVYLIPSELRQDALEEDAEAIPLHCSMDFRPFLAGSGARTPSPFDQLSFSFSTLMPGDYRLLAVWDRRAPFAQPGARGVPGDGDYISAESPVFKIAAGAIIEDLILECTNRVGDAEEYFAADEAWQRLQSTNIASINQPPLPTDRITRFSPARIISEPPLSQWVLKTHKEGREAVLQRAALVESRPGDPSDAGQLELTFAVRARNPWLNLFELEVQIYDEHGCGFSVVETSGGEHAGKLQFVARAPVFPRSGRFEVKIRASRNSQAENILASYTLTNAAGATRQNWIEEPRPMIREIDGAKVELTKIWRTSNPEYRIITADGSEASWQTPQWEYWDPWGNWATELRRFCREENVIKMRASFHRSFSFDFHEREKWMIPMADLPDPGEFRKLDLRTQMDGVDFELLTIAGKGTFNYVNNEVQKADAFLDKSALPAIGSLPARNEGSQMVFVQNDLHASVGNRQAHEDIVVSRVPHASFRVRGLKPQHRWTVLEEREPAWHSLKEMERQSATQDEPWYIGLNRTTIGRTGRLTIILQNVHPQEFIVRLPER